MEEGRKNRSMGNVFLWLFLLLVPTQLGKHFWPEWSLVKGVRIDYLSPTIYLVDVVWLGWYFWELLAREKKKKDTPLLGKVLVAGWAVINILWAENRWVTIYRWARIFQAWWVVEQVREKREVVVKSLRTIVPIWVLMEMILVVGEISLGRSVEGWWYWLGERRFNFSTIGIAQISWWGQGIVRAYGTFSHPNSLAGFMVAVGAYWMLMRKKTEGIWWWVVVWSILVIVVLSGSRSGWVAMAVVVAIAGWKQWWKKGKNWWVGILAIGGLLTVLVGMMGVNYEMSRMVGGWDSESWSKRLELNRLAINMWRSNFLTGVGMGGFTSAMVDFVGKANWYWWQPVHNVFLLWASENGMVGIIATTYWLAEWWANKRWSRVGWVAGVMAIMGLVDHYWLTLPQNNWWLMVVMGLI